MISKRKLLISVECTVQLIGPKLSYFANKIRKQRNLKLSPNERV